MFIRGKFVVSDAEIIAALQFLQFSKPICSLTLDDFRDWCWLNFVQMNSEAEVYAAAYQCIKSGYIGA